MNSKKKHWQSQRGLVFAFHVSHHPPAYRVRTYDFEEDTICKGAFYVLPPEYSYDLEDTPPEKGIIKGVFTCDYTKQGNGIRIHRFTLSYETADSITVRNTQIYGKGLQPVSFEGNEFAIDLRLTLRDVLKAVGLCVVEVSCLRFVMAWVRMTALIGYRKKKHTWGHIERQKIQIK